MDKEVTFYSFYSAIRAFLSGLLRDPIHTEPNKLLKDNGFNKSKLINILMSKSVLERHEKILDSTNSEEKTAKYNVTFKVRKKDFETRIHRIYSKYFEKNVYSKKKNINECDGGGAACAVSDAPPAGATNCASNGAFIQPIGDVMTRGSFCPYKKGKTKGNNIDPTKVLGKTVNEGKKNRKIYITAEQFSLLQEIFGTNNNGDVEKAKSDEETLDEVTACGNVGNFTYDAPAFLDKETADRSPGFSMKRV